MGARVGESPTATATATARVGPWKRAAVARRRGAAACSGGRAPVPRRAALLTGCGGMTLLALADVSALAASRSLAERVERRDLPKPVFNRVRPGPQTYPAWLGGEWTCRCTFEGFAFPSRNLDRKALMREPTVPGFQKLSLVYVPDVGAADVAYRARFVRAGAGDSDGDGDGYAACEEDRAFNLASIVDAYLERPGAVESVEYDRAADANRATVRLAPGASTNAERIELFTNARESETRAGDGTFFASEALRQVTLGFSRDFNQARVVNTDYQHVWSYTPTYEADGTVRRVRCALSTAGYIQPSDAMRLTATPQPGGGAPMPSLGTMGTASFEPAVLYSHTILMEKHDPE